MPTSTTGSSVVPLAIRAAPNAARRRRASSLFSIPGAGIDEQRPPQRTGISDDALAELTAYSFPGNVRELHSNIIERLVILTPDDRIGRIDDVRTCLGEGSGKEASGLYRPECSRSAFSPRRPARHPRSGLAHHDGHMAATARSLDLERSHLYKKCKALGLARGQGRRGRGGQGDGDDESRKTAWSRGQLQTAVSTSGARNACRASSGVATMLGEQTARQGERGSYRSPRRATFCPLEGVFHRAAVDGVASRRSESRRPTGRRPEVRRVAPASRSGRLALGSASAVGTSPDSISCVHGLV